MLWGCLPQCAHKTGQVENRMQLLFRKDNPNLFAVGLDVCGRAPIRSLRERPELSTVLRILFGPDVEKRLDQRNGKAVVA